MVYRPRAVLVGLSTSLASLVVAAALSLAGRRRSGEAGAPA
jgi:hypothetical protein